MPNKIPVYDEISISNSNSAIVRLFTSCSNKDDNCTSLSNWFDRFQSWKILVNQVWLPSLENTDFLLDSFVASAETRALTGETGLTGWTARIGFNGRSTLWDLTGFSELSSDTMREPLAVRIVSAPVRFVDATEDVSDSPRRLKTELSFWTTENSRSYLLCELRLSFLLTKSLNSLTLTNEITVLAGGAVIGDFVTLVILIFGDKRSISFGTWLSSSFPSRSNADLRLTGTLVTSAKQNRQDMFQVLSQYDWGGVGLIKDIWKPLLKIFL